MTWILPESERVASPNFNRGSGKFEKDVFIVHFAVDGDQSVDDEEVDQFSPEYGLSFTERERSHDCMDVARLFAKKEREASTQFVIGRDGSKCQMVSLDDTAWGAGGGAFPRGGTGPLEKARAGEINRRAIQVELCNAGFKVETLRVPNDERSRPMPHPGNVFKDLTWELYPHVQLETLLYLLALCRQAKPSLRWITGHEDVVNSHTISAKYGWPKNRDAKHFGGKVDPGPAFPWDELEQDVREMGYVPIRYDFRQRAWVER